MPRIPSEPSHRRSGAGPAPDAGKRRDSTIDTSWRHRLQALDEVINVGVEGGEMSPGTRGNPAPKRGAGERLGEEAEGEFAGFQLPFQFRAAGTCLDEAIWETGSMCSTQFIRVISTVTTAG
jgi:hypothetical protein